MNISAYITKKIRHCKTGRTLFIASACIGGSLFYTHCQAQTNGPLTLSSPNTSGNYSSNTSVTLSAGFTSTGPFSATIQSIDCIPFTTNATTTRNFIMVTTPRISGYTTAGQLSGQGTCQVMQSIQYFDGLGRPVQTVQVKASPFGNDLVQPIAYDQYEREPVKYLPYALTANAVSDGSFKTSALTAQAAFYTAPPQGVTSIPTPQSASTLEASPLSRVLEQGAPGNPWQLSLSGVSGSGHTMKMIYAANDGVKYWANQYTVSTDGKYTLLSQQTYSTNQLDVTVTQDENWSTAQTVPNTQNDPRLNTTETYTDKLGHVVLKRTYNYTSAVQVLSTYYVYDDLGNLYFVLPPASLADATGGIPSANLQATLNNFCYQYSYDSRNRLASKQLPGKGIEYMVYNQLDQLVLHQDANQRVNNQWEVTKYDAQGRVIVTGLWNAGSVIAPATLQSSIYAAAQWDVRDYTNNTTTNPTGYVISSYPQLNKALTINFYDDYTFTGQPPAFVAPSGASTNTIGLLTGTKTTVLNTINNATPDMLWDVNYYDILGRNIQTYKQHYLGGTLNANNYDAVGTTYNFTNAPTTVTRKHWNLNNISAPLVTIANTYIYDHVGRKLKTWEQIINGSNAPNPLNNYLISQMVYNEVGQAMNKNLHSTDSVHFLQAIAYNYNERGWLLGSSAPLFAMQLQYNLNPAGVTGFTAQYNGNIANQVYTSSGQGTKNFNYTYDYLNRLISGTGSDSYSETGISYDLNGNITALNRYQGGTLIDQLGYTYNSTNQVQTIVDGSGNSNGLVNGTTTYTWDNTNGNLVSSTNTSVTTQNKSFTYNLLNLPQTAVTAIGGTDTYTYDATGQKLRKVNVNGANTVTTDYISGIQYKNNSTAIDFIQTDEGKAVPITGGYDYYYYLGDNLGNTRITFDTQSGTATALQTDDYYPFGLEISRGTITSPKNEYLYNRKELQEELGEYDYGFRFLDPVIGRWTTIDPSVEDGQESTTPYGYVFDDPMKFTDPDGRVPDITIEGQNNSSVTIKTDLIDATVNVSSLGIDFHGNHSIQGEQALQTGLDFVSLFDPTGIATGLSGVISAKNGDLFGAAMSFAGIVPGLGKIAEEEKVAKDVKVIEEAVVDGEKTAGKADVYNRQEQYGKTPTASDRKALGATEDDVVDHDPPLVKRYHEGDPSTGEKPGKNMTKAERKASANDRTRMKLQSKKESQKQGAEMSRYSKQKNKENGN